MPARTCCLSITIVALVAALGWPHGGPIEDLPPARHGVSATISDDSPSSLEGVSPYHADPDQAVQPRPDQAVLMDEIHPQQSAWINAALGGEAYRIGDHACAGWPQCVRPHAIPSNVDHYCGYWVGGGAACHGEPRYATEGTYGWDYFGHLFCKRVALGWHHSRYQGGTGAYQTDGPKVCHRE